MEYKQVVTYPAANPVTLSEVKAHLRITVADHDTYIKDCIIDAREYIERITGYQLTHSQFDITLDAFPLHDLAKIKLPLTPVQSIESIKYYDNDDVLQTWSASEYVLDNAGQISTIYPARDYSWPTARNFYSSVIIRINVGPEQQATGLAQSGSGSEIVLAATDTAADDYYNQMIIDIVAGKGVGQYSRITAYDSATKAATLSDAWSPALDATSEYIITAAVPHPFNRAMYLLIGHWFENREETTSAVSNQIEAGVKALITPYKVWRQK